MRFVLITLLSLLVACAPNIQANPGEIVYIVSEHDYSTFGRRTRDTDPAYVAMMNFHYCFFVQKVGEFVPQDYRSFASDDFANEPNRTFLQSAGYYGRIYESKRFDNTNKIRMTWSIQGSNWPYARIKLNTETNDPKLNVRLMENHWFQCLDRRMTRVASAR